MTSHRAPTFGQFGTQLGALLSPVVAVLVMLINLLAHVVDVLVILARLPAVDRALAGVRATSPVGPVTSQQLVVLLRGSGRPARWYTTPDEQLTEEEP